MVCPSCWKHNPEDASHCAYCGTVLLADTVRRYDLLGSTVVDGSLAEAIQGASKSLNKGEKNNSAFVDTGAQTAQMRTPTLNALQNSARNPQSSQHNEPSLTADTTPPDNINDTVPNFEADTVVASDEVIENGVRRSQESVVEKKSPKSNVNRPGANAPYSSASKKEKNSATKRPKLPSANFSRFLMVISGLILGLAFASPILMGGKIAIHGNGLDRFEQLFLVGAAVAMFLSGLFPLPYVVRATIGFLMGAVPLVVFGISHFTDWRQAITLCVTAILPAFLLHRGRRDHATGARIAMAIGVMALATPLLAPVNGAIPAIQLFQGLKWDTSDWVSLIPRLYPAVLFMCCFWVLLALIGKRAAFLARACALALLLYLPAQQWIAVAFASNTVKEAFSSPAIHGIIQGGVHFVYLVVAAMGLSQIIWAFASEKMATSPTT